MSTHLDHRTGLGPWKGQVFLAVGRALYLGPAGDTTPHAHHAVQMSIALETPLRLRHHGEEWREYDGVIVPADVPHQLDGGRGDLALFYIEPESTEGRSSRDTSSQPVRSISVGTISAVRAAVRRVANHPRNQTSLSRVFAELMESVGLPPQLVESTDLRIEQAVRRLRTTPRSRTSIPDLARSVGLSPRRFRHLFRREIGMSAQSYIVWLRCYEACAALAQGASISDAALHAGFSDAAHFSRTFRRTFGLAPSQLADRLTLIEAPVGLGNRAEAQTRFSK